MAVVRELDFSTSLPAGVTFSRTGTRRALQSGLFTVVASNTPAFESVGSRNLGLSIQSASSNIFTTDAYGTSNPWWLDDASVTTTANSLTGANDAWIFSENAGTGNVYQQLYSTPSGLANGERFCFSAYVSHVAGSEPSYFELAQTVIYNNAGQSVVFRADGVHGVSFQKDTTNPQVFSDPVIGYETINADWQRVWISGIKQPAAFGPSFMLRSVDVGLLLPNTPPNVLHRTRIYGLQLEAGVRTPSTLLGPAGSVAEDVVTITDLTGFNAAAGTIVIEYDAYDGALLSQSGTSLLSASKPGKTAIAWSGSTSSTCTNAGIVTPGGSFSVTGPLRLLQGARGRIRRIVVHDVRMSDADLRAATVKTQTHTPGVLRVATTHNRLPSKLYSPTAGFNHISRFPFKFAFGASSVRLLIHNNICGLTTTGDIPGAEFNIVRCALEYGGTHVPVLFGGNQGATVPAGALEFLSDPIPGIADATEGFIRIETSGSQFPAARWAVETGANSFCYNTSTATASNVYSTGPIVLTSGTGQQFFPHGMAPVIVGIPSDSLFDPDAVFIAGDSLTEGTGDLNSQGTYFQKAAHNANKPLLMHSVGGESHTERNYSTGWHAALKYCRVMFDELYANQASALKGHALSVHHAARQNNIGWIGRVEALPSTGSSDLWTTIAGQTDDNFKVDCDQRNALWLGFGAVDDILLGDGVIDRPSVRKWVVDGVTPRLMTTDGLHTSVTADNILATNATALFNNILVSQPETAEPVAVSASTAVISISGHAATIQIPVVIAAAFSQISISANQSTVELGQPVISISAAVSQIQIVGRQATIIVNQGPVVIGAKSADLSMSSHRAVVFAGSITDRRITTFRAYWLN